MADSTVSANSNQHIILLEVEGKNKEFNDALTTDLVKVKILNSSHNLYPLIELSFISDNEYIMNNQFYGQGLITMRIQLVANNERKTAVGGSGASSIDEIVMQLIYAEGNLDLSPKSENNATTPEDIVRDKMTITTIPLPSYATANKFFNKIYEEPCSKTPFEIIDELLRDRKIDNTYVEIFGKNKSKINQLIIPPMKFHQVINYINDKFGIYKGPMFRYFDYTGQFLMWDLYEKMKMFKESPSMNFYKFPSHFVDSTKSESVQDEVYNDLGKTFIIFGKIKTLNYPNSKISVTGNDNIFITHPHESLYQTSVINSKDSIKDQGIINQKDELLYHDSMNTSKTYRIDQIGFESDGYSGEYDQTAMLNKISHMYRNNFTIRFNIDVHLWIQHLFHIGQIIGITILTDYEQNIDSDYGGAYILDQTDIVFNKSDGEGGDNYTSHCTVTASRSVLTRK